MCPNQYDVFAELARTEVSDDQIRGLIGQLVRHGVAVTSTLAAIEMFSGRDTRSIHARLACLAPGLREHYRASRERWLNVNDPGTRLWDAMLQKEMAFERAFVKAGGKLMAGVDPTGWGGIVAGFGDQRELELLVEAGFTPEQAIEIATANGASFLLESNEIGTIAAGKRADLLVVRGNPFWRTLAHTERRAGLQGWRGLSTAWRSLPPLRAASHQFDLWHILYSPLDLALLAFVGLLLAAAIARRTRRHRIARRASLQAVMAASR